MKKFNASFLIAACVFMSSQAMAHGGVSIFIGPPVVTIAPPPPPPPVVVAPAPPPPVYYAPPPPPAPVVEYRYYPAWNVYYDPPSGLYWSLQYGNWVLGALPAYIYPPRLGRYYVVPSAHGQPWRYYHPPRGYGRGYYR